MCLFLQLRPNLFCKRIFLDSIMIYTSEFETKHIIEMTVSTRKKVIKPLKIHTEYSAKEFEKIA